MDRRAFVQRSSLFALQLLGVSGCSTATMKRVRSPSNATAPSLGTVLPFYDAPGPIVPIRADLDRIFRVTVCLRPFRSAGPRQDVERVGDKIIVHNYGHGGSGWSLSWGSADVVIRRALEARPGLNECAVVGCGALGLTAALTSQRMGIRTTIYSKERPPYVRSSRATGSWTPDSRVALASGVAPDFGAAWEKMARISFGMYQSYLGSPGTPIEWTDRYWLRDEDDPRPYGDSHGFVHYGDRIADLTPHSQEMPSGSTPFPTRHVRRSTTLTFNVASYTRALVQEFQVGGGSIETREFHTPADLTQLPQSTIIDCTGYGARSLWSDDSLVPIRGQIAWLIPQEGANYGIMYKDLYVLARRDGIVIQPLPQGDDTGWDDSNEQPDRTEAEQGVRTLQELYSRMGANLQSR